MAAGKRVAMAEVSEAEDLLRILLKKWSEQVERSGDLHVWEKDSQRGPAIAVENTDVDDAATERGLIRAEESGFIGVAREQQEFSVNELFRRLRRIEKLTTLIKEREENK